MHLRVSCCMLLCCLCAPAAASIAPPESLWTDEVFRKRFIASYGFDGPHEPTISSQEQELLQSVLPLLESGRYPAAAVHLQHALAVDSSAALPFTLGNIYFQAGELDAANQAYRQAIEKFPGFRRAHRNLGFSRVRQGRLREALPSLLEAVRLGDGDGPLYGLIGYAYLVSGRPAQALPAYERALMLQPDSLDWRLGWAQALFATGEYRKATAVAGDILETHPQRGDIWLLQANALLALGDADTAATNLEIVRRMGAADADALMLLGDIHLNRNLVELAWPAYREAMRGDRLPDVSRVLRAASGFVDRQAWTQAQSLAALIEARYRDHLTAAQTRDLHMLRAQIALSRGEEDAAAGMLADLLEKDPLNGRALLLLSDHVRKQGDAEHARFLLSRAVSIADYEADARVRLAAIYIQWNQFEEAIRQLERAQAVKPREQVGRYLDQVRRHIR